MGNQLIDLTGKRFGKLTVIGRGQTRKTSGGQQKLCWRCQCDCGNVIEVDGQKLRNGHTQSCGCIFKDYRPSRFKDLTGMRFGRLTVVRLLEQSERKTKQYNWLCRCDCGNLVHANASKLQTGLQKSCGCFRQENLNNIGDVNRKYKVVNKRLYAVYKSMLERCYSSDAREYQNYGGRGISVCAEWLGDYGFDAFAEWAFENGYDPNAEHGDVTLDRIDVDGNYSPSNCRWISNAEQQNNKRTCIYQTYNGETHTLKEWSRILNISYSKIRYHYHKGKTLSEIVNM